MEFRKILQTVDLSSAFEAAETACGTSRQQCPIGVRRDLKKSSDSRIDHQNHGKQPERRLQESQRRQNQEKRRARTLPELHHETSPDPVGQPPRNRRRKNYGKPHQRKDRSDHIHRDVALLMQINRNERVNNRICQRVDRPCRSQ